MYNVLIVDDEPWVAYGLRALIDWNSLGYNVIGEANNGIQAMEMIASTKPEVVISDIRMPGLSGIELLERIREQGLITKVILISGYAEFEYAQQAIRLGAFDYLLKQVEKNKLTDALIRLKAELVEKQKANKELDLLLEDLFDLFEPDNNIKISNFLTQRMLEFHSPHFRFISCMYPHFTSSDGGESSMEPNDVQWVRFRTGQNKMSYLVNYDEQKNPLALLNFISDALSQAQYAGISSIGLYLTPIGKLYQESDIALISTYFYRQAERISEYKAADHTPALNRLIPKIELGIKDCKPELIEKALDEISLECIARRMPVDQISTVYNHIVSLFYKHYSGSEFLNGIEYLHYSQIIRTCGSVQQFFDRLKINPERQTGEESSISNETVRKIIDCIDSSYTQDLSLGTLAIQFNVSLGYLSTLIKKEMGSTYTDYVLAKRMKLATELLNDPSLSIQEVVEQSGYKDYFHFNKLFKKYFGVTPSKYRKA